MYIIRADGNAKIGAGHLMRCLTIAQALAKRLDGKKEICFWCAEEASGDLVRSHGFQAKVLGTDYRNMETELTGWEKLTSRNHIILVDSYYATDSYLNTLRKYGKVYLLDDMQQHVYPVDAVINYNAFADVEKYHNLYAGTGTICLIGSDYVPVREQFLNRAYQVQEKVTDVLITTGGGDIDNIAGELLKEILCEGVSFHVVSGRYNPHLEALQKLKKTYPEIHIYHDVENMAELMQKCDLAITAGGTTIYELAAIGVPFLCFSYAKNQEALTEYIGTCEIAGYLGAYHLERQAVMERLPGLFAEYCDNRELRTACHMSEKKMIDGKGAERLAEKIYQQKCI